MGDGIGEGLSLDQLARAEKSLREAQAESDWKFEIFLGQIRKIQEKEGRLDPLIGVEFVGEKKFILRFRYCMGKELVFSDPRFLEESYPFDSGFILSLCDVVDDADGEYDFPTRNTMEDLWFSRLTEEGK